MTRFVSFTSRLEVCDFFHWTMMEYWNKKFTKSGRFQDFCCNRGIAFDKLPFIVRVYLVWSEVNRETMKNGESWKSKGPGPPTMSPEPQEIASLGPGIVKQPSSPNKALLHLDFQKAFDSVSRVNTDQVLRPRTAQIARHQFEDDRKNGSGTACFTWNGVVTAVFSWW